MSKVAHYVMSEEDRLALLDLRNEQESLEVFIAGGSPAVSDSTISRYKRCLYNINEFKRRMLEEFEQLDEDMFDYTFFFDTVAGVVWIEDAE